MLEEEGESHHYTNVSDLQRHDPGTSLTTAGSRYVPLLEQMVIDEGPPHLIRFLTLLSTFKGLSDDYKA